MNSINEKKWYMKNGEAIKVKNMTSNHIKNCINALKNGRIKKIINLGYFEDNDFQIIEEDELWAENWIKLFEMELKHRNEQI